MSAKVGSTAWARSTKSLTESIEISSAGSTTGIRVRHRQRRHAEDDLARDPESLTAGGQDPQAGAAPEERLRDGRARVDQVLAVVEDEQDLAVAQMLDDELDVRLGLPLPDAEHVGHGLDDEGGVADCRELDQPHAVAVRADLR